MVNEITQSLISNGAAHITAALAAPALEKMRDGHQLEDHEVSAIIRVLPAINEAVRSQKSAQLSD